MHAGRPSGSRLDAVDRGFVFLDVVLLLVLGWLLWLVLDVGADQRTAATGGGERGVIVIDGMRQGYRSQFPVGTFTAADGTRTPDVAWQSEPGHPVTVGDRLEGVLLGDRVWPPDAELGRWDFAIIGALGGAMLWRVTALTRRIQRPRQNFTPDRGPG